jgi:hypothetical protein
MSRLIERNKRSFIVGHAACKTVEPVTLLTIFKLQWLYPKAVCEKEEILGIRYRS